MMLTYYDYYESLVIGDRDTVGKQEQETTQVLFRVLNQPLSDQ